MRWLLVMLVGCGGVPNDSDAGTDATADTALEASSVDAGADVIDSGAPDVWDGGCVWPMPINPDASIFTFCYEGDSGTGNGFQNCSGPGFTWFDDAGCARPCNGYVSCPSGATCAYVQNSKVFSGHCQ